MKMMLCLRCVAGVILLNIAGSLCQLNVCGKAPLNHKKIVGGQNAREGSWPWQASIHTIIPREYICGGTLVNAQWVLSAAHCFEGFSGGNIRIYLGRHRQTGLNRNEVSRTVMRLIIHHDYDEDSKNNDIALLQLSSTVTFSDYIKPVCLASASSEFNAGTKTWVTGWGSLNFGSSETANILQEVQIPVVSNSVCQSAYGSIITSNMLCAGLKEGGKDSCLGDSGGPLVVKKLSRWIQAGIVSFGHKCALPNFPGVYTRVSKYQGWINSHIIGDKPGFVSSSIRGSPNLLLFSLSLTVSSIPLIFSLYLFT
ncbi:prostasin-like [Carassius gibelio]|uniref:prostasin-like n=1 Tax=Carassius gibelio TaxID=101364 RepID=UPI0022778330|nr:prostasin-like [Carassius gibelio]